MTPSSQTLSRTLPGLVSTGAVTGTTAASRLFASIAAWRCRLQGHAPALCVDDNRLYLACPDCRLESPGWRLDIKAPRPRFAGAPDRFARYAWVMGRGR
jgi:hypothetical protein